MFPNTVHFLMTNLSDVMKKNCSDSAVLYKTKKITPQNFCAFEYLRRIETLCKIFQLMLKFFT